MNVDNASEAYESPNSNDKGNNVGLTRDNDGRKELQFSDSVSQDITKYQNTENPRKQIHGIEKHKEEYPAETVKELESRNSQNILTLNNQGKMSPRESGATKNTFLTRELEKKGYLIYLMQVIKRIKDFFKGSVVLGTTGTAKEEPIPHKDVVTEENDGIKTLEDALGYFDLSSDLQKLETSLEDVRRNKKVKEDHEDVFKQIDKKIQNLSRNFHPDKVKNRGGTEKEIALAQKKQTAINATRMVLKLLNSAFIEDIDIDHKFGFYTKLSISSLCNEDGIKNCVNEVILKIGMMSQIKQQNVISEIRKFLIESKNCVDSYLGNKNDFEEYRDSALFHLNCCINGFEKLCTQLEDVIEQCKSEKNGENMHSLIQNMASDRKNDLKLLKLLDKTAGASLNGKYRFFSSMEVIDPYFVLPLVFYTNVILMCNVMVRNKSFWDIWNFYSELDPNFRDDLEHLKVPYYLASYCSGNTYHEKTVLNIMGKNKEDFMLKEAKEEIKIL